MTRITACFVAGMLLAGTASRAAAQDSVPRPWKLQTDFGFVNTAGNTSTTTLNAGEAASYSTGRWTFGQQFTAVYGRTDGEQSAENYTAGLRSDYSLASGFGVYGLGGWSRNEFAGITRRFEEGVGLTFKAIAQERTTLGFEAGVSANQQRSTEDVEDNYAAGRGAVLFKQLFATSAYFLQTGEILPSFKTSDDYLINTETSVVAPLSRSVAFKAGYVIHFDHDPEPGFKQTDRYLTSGLQIVF